MRKRLLVGMFLFLTVFCFQTSSQAVDLFEGTLKALHIDEDELVSAVIGIGVLYHTSPYTGDEDDTWAIPIIVGEYKNFFSDGHAFGYTVNKDDEVELSVILQPRFMGYDDDESTELNGMDDREWSIDGGLKAEWLNEWFELDVTFVTDLSGKHEGQEISAIFSKEFMDGFITPRAGVKWRSEQLTDYYFGVRPSEVTVNRANYEPDSTVDYIAGIAVAVPLGDDWAIVGDFEFEGLGDEIQDSPIVDRDETFTYVLGAVYRF